MAKNGIRSRTVTFMAVQSAILGIIMLLFVVLASILFVKNATRWQLRNIEDDVLMFAKQAARSGEVPKRGDLGAYTFFILTQDGKYVLPRLPRADDGERQWQEYEHKLVYEMQKRRDGWIFYPDRDQALFGDGQYVIRYVYLEQQGWIVAVEGYVASGWSLLKGFLTPKLFLGLFLIVAVAFGLMLLSAFWHFRRVMKAILRAQENNYIVAPASTTSIAQPVPSAFIKRDETSFAGSVMHNNMDRDLPRQRPENVERVLPPVREAEPLREDERERQKEHGAPRPRLQEPAFSPRQLDDLGNVTIDTMGIRSPLLKKAIEELREEKK